MSVDVVARKDFADAVRAKTLWVLVALFTLVISLASWFFGDAQAAGGGVAGDALILSLLIPCSILLPAIGIMVGYKAIVGERTSGSIKLLLSLPNERRDVLFGKFLGRSGVVAAAVTLGCLFGAVVFAVFASSFPITEYVLFVLLTIALGVVFVAIAVGFSASTRSDTVAIIGGIGLALLFTLLWDILTLVVGIVINDVSDMSAESVFEIQVFLNSINPSNAYGTLARELLSEGAQGGGGGLPAAIDGFYTEPWFAVVVLLVWLVAPLALGYWRFETAELT